jgi:hypothetical protein
MYTTLYGGFPMPERSAIPEQFVQNSISKLLTSRGIPTNNATLRAALDADAVVETSGREAAVRIVTNLGRELSLADRLDELQQDPTYRSAFPPAPKKTVDHRDMESLRQNFNDVAAGKIAVE